jgi:paraquat-inducible protein B
VVGVFVLGAIVLIVSVIAVYGAGWFERRYTFVMDFETSLDGLVQGSPVRFRGITVGSVSRIAMRYADDGQTIQTPVYIQITEGQVEGGGRDIDDPDEWIEAWVERGLRAELKSLSFVTGQLARTPTLDMSRSRPRSRRSPSSPSPWSGSASMTSCRT